MPKNISAKKLEHVLKITEKCVNSGNLTELKTKLDNNKDLPKIILKNILNSSNQLVKSSKESRNTGFIVITGIDKTGKTTQCFNPDKLKNITSIHKILLKLQKKVLKISLPAYNTYLGSLIGAYLGKESKFSISGKLSPDYAWILWSLDRAQYNNRVINWLNLNKENVVLADRWTESNIAYQKAVGIDHKRILEFEKKIIKPTNIIILNMPIEMLNKRSENMKDKNDLYEENSFLKNVQKIYLKLNKYYPYGTLNIVNSSDNVKTVNKNLIKIIKTIDF